MAYRIKFGDKEVYKDTDKVSNKDNRSAFAMLLLTKSTDSDSAMENATKLGGIAYAEAISKLPADLTVTVYEKPEGKTEEKLRADYPLSAVVNRIKAAVTQNERQGKIYPYSSDKTSTKEDKPAASPLDFLSEFNS